MDFPPEVSFFSLNFSCFGRYSGKKLVKMGSENGKMLENRKRKWIFNRKSANFSKFSRLHALCGKKLRNLATGNGNRVQNCLKTLVFEKKTRIFSKNFEKLPVFSKKITGNGNRMLRNLEFGPKIKFSKASPQYFGKKLRNFPTGNGNRVQKCLKNGFLKKQKVQSP